MGVTVNKRKNTGDWYVWISANKQRTSRKVGSHTMAPLYQLFVRGEPEMILNSILQSQVIRSHK